MHPQTTQPPLERPLLMNNSVPYVTSESNFAAQNYNCEIQNMPPKKVRNYDTLNRQKERDVV